MGARAPTKGSYLPERQRGAQRSPEPRWRKGQADWDEPAREVAILGEWRIDESAGSRVSQDRVHQERRVRIERTVGCRSY